MMEFVLAFQNFSKTSFTICIYCSLDFSDIFRRASAYCLQISNIQIFLNNLNSQVDQYTLSCKFCLTFLSTFFVSYDPVINCLQGVQKFFLRNPKFQRVFGSQRGQNKQHLNFVKNDYLVYHMVRNFIPINLCNENFL